MEHPYWILYSLDNACSRSSLSALMTTLQILNWKDVFILGDVNILNGVLRVLRRDWHTFLRGQTNFLLILSHLIKHKLLILLPIDERGTRWANILMVWLRTSLKRHLVFFSLSYCTMKGSGNTCNYACILISIIPVHLRRATMNTKVRPGYPLRPAELCKRLPFSILGILLFSPSFWNSVGPPFTDFYVCTLCCVYK